MKRIAVLFIFLSSAATLLQAQGPWSFKGTVTRMRMTDCTMQRGFMAAMAGNPAQTNAGTCPEYTVISDKVVYVVVGRRADEFMPLAENMEFSIRKNELVRFSDDEKVKSRFTVQQMMLRAEWDREEAQKEHAAKMMERSASYETRNPPPDSGLSTSAR